MSDNLCNPYLAETDISRRLEYHVTWSLVTSDEGKSKKAIRKGFL